MTYQQYDASILSAGDTAHIAAPEGWGQVRYTSGTVKQVTPTGQIVVELRGGLTRRFNAQGDQIGAASALRRQWLVSEEEHRSGEERDRLRREQADLKRKLTALGIPSGVDDRETALASLRGLLERAERLL